MWVQYLVTAVYSQATLTATSIYSSHNVATLYEIWKCIIDLGSIAFKIVYSGFTAANSLNTEIVQSIHKAFSYGIQVHVQHI